MILNASVPTQLAKFGDTVRYIWQGSRQVDTAFDLDPRSDGQVSVRWGSRLVPPENVLEVVRPIEVNPGDVWVTDRGYEARILETSAPGLHPIVALLVRNGTSTPLQFSWCGISATSNHQLLRPKSMEDAKCTTPTPTSTSSSAATSTA